MFRTLNADILNEIANNPTVRPFLGGTEPLELSSIVGNPVNFCFLTNDKLGGHILLNKGNGIYEVHTLSLPKSRGKTMLRLMQDARAFMFLNTDCIELQTIIPDGQASTNVWAHIAGFEKDYWRDNCFNYNGMLGGATYMSLVYKDWILKDKENLKAGKLFHTALDIHEALDHSEDPVHDAWAGSVVRASRGGNLTKAISYYNQWAARCGYAPATILSLFPFTVSMGSVILQLGTDGSMYGFKKGSEFTIVL